MNIKNIIICHAPLEIVKRSKGHPLKNDKKPDDRHFLMRDLFLAGKTLQEIGDSLDPVISRERVRQLLKKHFGLTRKDGGKFLRSTPLLINMAIHIKINKNLRDEQRYKKHFFCGVDEFLHINKTRWTQTMRKDGSLASVYFLQKHSASTRCILWDITFPEWYKVWTDSGKLSERGRGSGKYCMSRIGDTGGYHKDNVEIKTNALNVSESFYKHPGCERSAKTGQVSRGSKTHCGRGHEKTPENISIVNGCMSCRICNNLRQKTFRDNLNKK